MSNVSPYMRREEAADFLGVSIRTISELQRKRLIPFVRIGRKCILFHRDQLSNAMEKLTVKAVGM